MAVVGAFATLATLWAGLLGLFAIVVVGNGGAGLFVPALKVAMIAGWASIVIWLLRELIRGRWRFVIAPFAAWAWVYLLALVLGRAGTVNIGY